MAFSSFSSRELFGTLVNMNDEKKVKSVMSVWFRPIRFGCLSVKTGKGNCSYYLYITEVCVCIHNAQKQPILARFLLERYF